LSRSYNDGAWHCFVLKKFCVVLLLLVGTASASDATVAPVSPDAPVCKCAPTSVIDPNHYAKLTKDSDAVFVGRIVDRIYISPLDYIAVFEERRFFAGKTIAIESKKYGVPIRYVMVSEASCSFDFNQTYKNYIVFAKARSKNLLFADKCGGTTLYKPEIAALLKSQGKKS